MAAISLAIQDPRVVKIVERIARIKEEESYFLLYAGI